MDYIQFDTLVEMPSGRVHSENMSIVRKGSAQHSTTVKWSISNNLLHNFVASDHLCTEIVQTLSKPARIKKIPYQEVGAFGPHYITVLYW